MPDAMREKRGGAGPTPAELREIVKNLDFLKALDEAEVLPLEKGDGDDGGDDEDD